MKVLSILPIHYPLELRHFKGKEQSAHFKVLSVLESKSLAFDQLLGFEIKQSILISAINCLIGSGFIVLSLKYDGPLKDQRQYFYQITQKGLVELKKWKTNGGRLS